MSSSWCYPQTKRDLGCPDDPYRWLEGPADAPDISAWVTEQNTLTNSLLESDSCKKTRSALQRRLTEVYNYPKTTCTFKRGERYFYSTNSGLQNQFVLKKQKSLADEEPEVLIDPNTIEKDGTASLSITAFSYKGDLLAFGVSRSGSDWVELQIMRVDTLEILPNDVLRGLKFASVAWLHDGSGFFYTRYPVIPSKDQAGKELESITNQRVCFHLIGTTQDDDVLIIEDKTHPTWLFGASITDDGQMLLVTQYDGCKPANTLFYTKNISLEDIQQIKKNPGNFQLVCVIDNMDWEYNYITNQGSLLYFQTNNHAPNGKVITIDLQHPEESAWREVISETTDVLSSVSCVKQNVLITCYLHNVHVCCITST